MEQEQVDYFRKGLEVVRHNIAYLNSASVSPLHDEVVSAINEGIETQRLKASLAQSEWFEKMDEARAEVAKFINAKPQDVSLMPNTSTGIIRALSSLRLREGDEVVYLQDEFPSLYWPLRGLGRQKVRMICVKRKAGQDLTEAVLSNIGQKTRLVALSWVGFFSGERIDLTKLSEEKKRSGFHLLVDVMQGLGCVPLDVSALDIDFLAEHSAKWLMGPVGIGFLYASESARKLMPDFHGWYGHEMDWDCFLRRDTSVHNDARRFETGTPPISLVYGLISAVKKLNEFGARRIWERVRKLTSSLISSLKELPVEIITPCEDEKRAGIVTFKCKNPKELFQKLEENKIIVSYREGTIRTSPHFWNIDAEVERLVSFIKEWLKRS